LFLVSEVVTNFGIIYGFGLRTFLNALLAPVMQFAVLPASSSDRPSSKPVSVQISDAVVPDHCHLCQLLTQ